MKNSTKAFIKNALKLVYKTLEIIHLLEWIYHFIF